MISIPLLLDQVSKRLGQYYLQLGTGLLFFLGQLFGALAVWVLGGVMKDFSKGSSMKALIYVKFAFMVIFLLGILADFNKGKKFGAGYDGNDSRVEDDSSVYESMRGDTISSI